VIEPCETRSTLAIALRKLLGKRELRPARSTGICRCEVPCAYLREGGDERSDHQDTVDLRPAIVVSLAVAVVIKVIVVALGSWSASRPPPPQPA
jgi:hypothetical protein